MSFGQILATQPSTETLQSLHAVLALESLSNSSNGILNAFSRLIPKTHELLVSISNPLRDLVSPTTPSTPLKTAQYRKVIQKIRALSFLSYADTLIMVPEGFQGQVVSYLKYLNLHRTDNIQKASLVMDDYIQELSVFLNNADARTAIKSHEAFYKKMKAERLDREKHIKAFFSPTDVRSRVKLSTVFARFGEFEQAFEEAERLQMTEEKQKALSQLLNQVTHASELLKLLKEKLENNELNVVSGDMAKHIATGAYEAACYIEMVTMYTFASEVMLSCVKELAEQFERITG
jgi:hypothetical protein